MDEPKYAPGSDADGRPLLPPVASSRRDSFPPPPSARRADTSVFAPPAPPARPADEAFTMPSIPQPRYDIPAPRYDIPAPSSQQAPVYDIPPVSSKPVYDIPPVSAKPAYDVPMFADKPSPVYDIPPVSVDSFDFAAPAPAQQPAWQSLADAPPPTAPAYPAAPPLMYDIPPHTAGADLPAPAPEPVAAAVPAWDSVPADVPPPVTELWENTVPPVAATQVYDLLSGEALPAEPHPAIDFEAPAVPLMAETAPEPPQFPAPRIDEPVTVVEDTEATGDLLGALREVLFRGASDLHISAGAPPMLRIDGALGPIENGKPWSREVVRSTLLGLLSPYERERFDSTLELDFAYTLTANARFRVNYYQDRGAMSAAFRIIPNEVKNLSQLGIPEAVASFATLPRGLVLVTGPTGSGKSTTLAALIDIVNSTRTDHIMTVEDPIEFLHRNKKSLVHQREVGRDTHSFSSALKHVLRQDPDVILIGELRDLETISTALTAAETGHLVFATLHTQDAAQTIDRIIDVYPPHQQMQIRSQLASTLQGIVCQTLVKRSTGAGRVVAAEVLMMTPAIGNLIREGKTFQIGSAMQAGRALGMATLDQHLAELVNDGSISRQSAIDKARDIASMTRMITRVDVADKTDGSFGSFAAPMKGQN